MKTITFNPENWNDNIATIKADGNELEVNGEKLTLVQQPPLFSEDSNVKWDFHSFEIRHEGHKIATVCRFGCDKQFELSGASISRQHEDPRILAGIAACNLL